MGVMPMFTNSVSQLPQIINKVKDGLLPRLFAKEAPRAVQLPFKIKTL